MRMNDTTNRPGDADITAAGPLLSPDAPLSVTIGGRAYGVKFSLAAEWYLSSRGKRVGDLLSQIATKEPTNVSAILELFSALTAHNFLASGEQPRDPGQWALVIPEEQFAQCADIVTAVLKRLVKNSQRARQQAAPVPAPAETAA